MPTARHVIALLQSHLDGEEQQFYSIAMQVAAHEARQGHSKVAQEIRHLIDTAKESQRSFKNEPGAPTPLIQPKGELSALLHAQYSDIRLSDMILPQPLRNCLLKLLEEQSKQQLLAEHGLNPRRKLLLIGAPGTGKSMTAAAIAGELRLPLFTVLYEGLITRFMGETASHLKLIFDAMRNTRGVYFFDEFDAIGSQRGNKNDTGEIRRVLNSCLQFLENDKSDSIILTATNHPGLLDKALFRRFDDILTYTVPDRKLIQKLILSRLGKFQHEWQAWEAIITTATGLSQAEIVTATLNSVKDAVLSESSSVSEDDMLESLKTRSRLISEIEA